MNHTGDISLAVLDMAGTTIEDTGQVPEAFAAALRASAIEVTKESLQGVRGISKRNAIQQLVEQQFGHHDPENPTRIAASCATFRRALKDRYITEGVRFIPGALETIAWLRERGIRVVLNTGFDRDIVDTIVGHLEWQNTRVDAIICGDDVPQGRPAPFMIFRAMEQTGIISVHRVMVVGDTARDLEAGYHAGVRYNVGVLSGAHTADLLQRVRHTHTLPSIADLPDLWRR